jgi:hypothetical protein
MLSTILEKNEKSVRKLSFDSMDGVHKTAQDTIKLETLLFVIFLSSGLSTLICGNYHAVL